MNNEIIIKIFRGGVKRPTNVEFYTNSNPTIRYTDLPRGIVAIVLLPVPYAGVDEVLVHKGDAAFLEHDGATIHAVRP